MSTRFTARQGAILAFIHRFTARHGVAPSYEEIASHFGTSSPSVNGTIKTLERRGLVSRVPGAARSLRVLVPAALLPGSEFGSPAPRRPVDAAAQVGAVDAAHAAAVAVLDALMERVDAGEAGAVVLDAARAVHAALVRIGVAREQAEEIARRLAAEAARWKPGGISVQRRQWTRR